MEPSIPRLRLLVIDDDEVFREVMATQLAYGALKDSVKFSLASSGQEGLGLIESNRFDVVITDLLMPGIDGREILARARRDSPETAVIVVTGDEDVRSAVACLKEGAYDYLPKPVDFVELELRLRRILEARSMRAEIDSLRSELAGRRDLGWELELPSAGMAGVRRTIDAIKDSEFPVLLLGESGSGKEVVADAIQGSSPRASGPYIKVNCAGLVSSLLESEMFGHEKGAFTGASAAKPGKFELAQGGTLFLDEIGEMELALQAKLLRVLQDGSYERVGGTSQRRADARIIAATNKDLAAEARAGRFREDLFYRLDVLKILIPPLRERKEDILVLACRFLETYARKYGKAVKGFSREAAGLLEAYSFPGNIRELGNAVARAFTMANGDLVEPGDLPEEIRSAGTREERALSRGFEPARPGSSSRQGLSGPASGEPARGQLNLEAYLGRFEEARIREALAEAKGNRSLAAEWLGISRRQLYNKLERYGIGGKS